ncbi:MAG: cupin domain-containing protein, partial [Gemmatimonadetes bacterium]|nr:cupin domain-containing protein [Gemmatimonadota bacterium]
CAHQLKNLTDMPVQVLRVRVAMDVDAETQQRHVNQFWEGLGVNTDAIQDVQPKAGIFNEQELKWRDAIHGGRGRIATRHVLSPDDFNSAWTFLDHAILSASGSVGYHYHDFLEESFVVLKGQGLMTIDDETFAVGPGSVTWQGIGQGHGTYNPGPEKLEFVRIAVKQSDREYTTIDLHDDLSARRPK